MPLVLLTLLLLSALAFAEQRFTPYQDYLYRVWSVESGLPQISVQVMVQDADGFIWMGTQNGLARFDGAQFDVFNTANSPELPSNLVTALLIDDTQQLWIGTSSGLVKRVGQHFVPVTTGRVGRINALAKSADGDIWVGADQLYRINADTLQVFSDHRGEVFSLLDSAQGLWVGANNGAGLISDNTYQWFSAPAAESSLQFYDLAFYHNQLWLGSQHGLYQFNGARWQQVQLPDLQGNRIELIFADQQDGLWITTLDRLFRWHNGRLQEQIAMPELDSFSWVESMLQDQHGNIWLGSRSHGVKRLRKAVTERYGREVGLSDAYTWAVQPWQHYMMVGSRKGIDFFDVETGRFEKKIADEQLPNSFVYSFYVDRLQRLWVGTRGGVAAFDHATLEPLFQVPEVAHLLITHFAEQGERLWLATNGGLFFIKNDVVTAFTHPKLPPDIRVRALYPDAQGQLWIGTEIGLFLLSASDDITPVFDPVLQQSFITTVFALPDQRLFVGTFDRGFSIGNIDNWQQFNQQSGLPGNGVIYAHLHDDILLISNFEGIYRLNYAALQQGSIEQLYMLIDDRRPEAASDSHRCCNGAGASKGALHANRLWFPTLNGVVAVNLQQVHSTATLPQPVITGVTVEQQTYQQHTVVLNAGQRDWQFSFSAPYFVQAGSLQFRYQLRGYDDTWVYAGNRRDAFYTNLRPGHYQFNVQVKAAADYRWSEASYITVQLPPYWYETKWFIFLVLLIGLFLLWAFYLLRMSSLDKAQQRLQRLIAERTAALHQANLRLQQMSMEDALTGLHNRHYLGQHIEQILARARRAAHPLMWVLVDIDHFKQINDKLGHQVGDDVLKRVAQILRQSCRNSDHALRWGGEEFLLLLENCDDAPLYLRRLRHALAQEDWLAFGLSQPLTCSIGAVPHDDQQSWSTCLQVADLALYQVKQQGRDNYVIVSMTADFPAHFSQGTLSLAEMLAKGWLTLTFSGQH